MKELFKLFLNTQDFYYEDLFPKKHKLFTNSPSLNHPMTIHLMRSLTLIITSKSQNKMAYSYMGSIIIKSRFVFIISSFHMISYRCYLNIHQQCFLYRGFWSQHFIRSFTFWLLFKGYWSSHITLEFACVFPLKS